MQLPSIKLRVCYGKSLCSRGNSSRNDPNFPQQSLFVYWLFFGLRVWVVAKYWLNVSMIKPSKGISIAPSQFATLYVFFANNVIPRKSDQTETTRVKFSQDLACGQCELHCPLLPLHQNIIRYPMSWALCGFPIEILWKSLESIIHGVFIGECCANSTQLQIFESTPARSLPAMVGMPWGPWGREQETGSHQRSAGCVGRRAFPGSASRSGGGGEVVGDASPIGVPQQQKTCRTYIPKIENNT